MLLRFSHDNRVTFLQNFVYRNQGLERLNFVGKHRLTTRNRSATESVHHIRNTGHAYLSQHAHFHASPEGGRRLVVPRIDDTAPNMFPW